MEEMLNTNFKLNTNNVPVEYIDYGIGFCKDIEDNKRVIQMNENLVDYPILFKYVFDHELKHYNNKGSILNDFWYDFSDGFNFKKMFLLFKFGLKYPSAFSGDLPFYYDKKDKRFYINYYSLILIILCLTILFIIILYIG